jgi:hypothetical protein
MPSKELQQLRAIVVRLTGSNDVKASEKSISRILSNYEWDNEKDFSDKDLRSLSYPITGRGV